MADNVPITAGSGTSVATDDVAGVHYQRVKLSLGADGAATDIGIGQAAMAASVPVVIASNQSAVPVSGTLTAVTTVGTITNPVAVTDNSGSLTVDAPVATPVFVRLSDGAAAITTLPVSIASVPSHAVTNVGTFVTQVDGAALTSLQLLDDVVVTDNAGFTDGTTKVNVAGYIYDEVAGTALTENDAAAARINVNRAVVSTIEDGITRSRYLTIKPGSTAAVTADTSITVQLNPVQPALTTPLNVNSAQINGVTPLMGAGNTGTGSLRVTLATDQANLTTPLNHNTAQISGVAVTMGAGASGTGVQRVAIATDGQGQIVDNVAFTDGTTRLDMAGYIFDETAGTALTENDAAAARVNANRAVVATLEDYATRARGITVKAASTAAASTDTALVVAINPLDPVSAVLAAGIVTCTTDITRPADTTAYAAADCLSDSTTVPTSGGFTFTGAARATGKSGIITDLMVTSSNPAGNLAGEVWVFDSSVTNVNDNAAFAISDAEVKTLIAKIPFYLVAGTNNATGHTRNLNIGFTTVGSANLRYLIRVGAAYTPISAEVITCRLKIMQVN